MDHCEGIVQYLIHGLVDQSIASRVTLDAGGPRVLRYKRCDLGDMPEAQVASIHMRAADAG